VIDQEGEGFCLPVCLDQGQVRLTDLPEVGDQRRQLGEVALAFLREQTLLVSLDDRVDLLALFADVIQRLGALLGATGQHGVAQLQRGLGDAEFQCSGSR